MSEETPKKIEDPTAAAHAADAAKPFMDELEDNKHPLSEEGRRTLEKISSRKMEEALAKYAQDKKESPQIRILRERALAALELPIDLQKIFVGNEWRGSLNKSWATRCKYCLEEFGKERIEEIIGSELSDTSQKLSELKHLSADLGDGMKVFLKGEIRTLVGNSEDFFWGYFIADLMDTDRTTRREDALEVLSRKAETQKPTLIRRHFGFFERARRSYPEIDRKLDPIMEQLGWIWDEGEKKYIELK